MLKSPLKRFAVIGNPVAHSLSPSIHQNFASQFDLRLTYEKICTEKENFQSVVETFFATGGQGLNITVPFKSAAAKLVSQCSAIAKISDSVNTIYCDQTSGQLIGDSTDGLGWIADIRRLQINLTRANILVIGAGGAARIILNQLLLESVALIHVCNRTKKRAQALTNTKISASGLDDIPDIGWDLVINTLSVGWQGSYPENNIQIKASTHAYDLNYGSGAKSFRDVFVSKGGNKDLFFDGWGMLVEQAAGSFFLWWDRRPKTADLIDHGIS